jgi:hypothetical protein
MRLLLEGFFACLYSLFPVKASNLPSPNRSLVFRHQNLQGLLPVKFIRRAVRKHRAFSTAGPLPPTADPGSLTS